MILNIYKPKGITSFGVVKKIRKIVGEKKVGHGGTLDPFAEGVLIIGTGSNTKDLKKITDTNKTYTASIKLGKTTNTLDPEGDVIEKKKIPRLNESKINKVLESFLGSSMQTPPMFSAKKIGGVKLYELARKNIIVDRKPTQINISDINLISFNETNIEFTVSCSKGTYIRVLGKDIAEKLGIDISTVSRSTRGKYVDTPYGVFELKYYLSESITLGCGKNVATFNIKRSLEKIILNEDKDNPYNDDILVSKLADENFKLARRTVAKYRDQLGYPVARLRKKI